MTIREIVTLPDPILRRKARPVTDFSPGFQELVDDMIETMRQAPGVGLAAPQIGVPLQLFVAEWGDDEDDEAPKKVYVFANPELKRFSRDTRLGVEGCLSIPGLVGEVERSLGVTVEGRNRRGQPLRVKAQGWLARIFQHETDHLNGVLFIDRADSVWQPVEENSLEK
ncbi:MAG TPA: peptide deformylase [Anaerolineales bacterium]|nr:peptide deformylase [Anaerolineales bacterium]